MGCCECEFVCFVAAVDRKTTVAYPVDYCWGAEPAFFPVEYLHLVYAASTRHYAVAVFVAVLVSIYPKLEV